MIKNSNLLILSLITILNLVPLQTAYGMTIIREENVEESYFKNSPPEINNKILTQAFISNIEDSNDINSIKNIKYVCKEWCQIVNDKQNNILKNAIISSFNLCEDEYKNFQRFLNGRLVYSLQDGQLLLLKKIADLKNPLRDTLYTSEEVSISTGYRERRQKRNKNKLEIWIAPWFLIKKELTSTATHLKGTCNWSDQASIGIFWAAGKWDKLGWYDYLIMKDFDSIGNNTLHSKYSSAIQSPFVCDLARSNFNMLINLTFAWHSFKLIF